jgi:hypothetical protein
MVMCDSSLQRTCFQRQLALHHSSRCLALCMVILGLCAADGHGNPLHKSPHEGFLCWCCFQRQFGTL